MPDFVALKVKEQHEDTLLSQPNVIGTGVGRRQVDGMDKPAIFVFVEKKLEPNDVIAKYSAADIIPEEIDGVPTKVIEVGKIMKQGFMQRIRPIQPGYSIGHGSITAGTLGGLFIDKDGELVALTNNHVGANENRASIGDIIYQPGPMDSQVANIKFNGWTKPAANLAYFGTLKRFVPLNRGNNQQDSAIIRVHQSFIDEGLINTNYPTLNRPIAGIGTPSIGMKVQKCGRTTGYTTGTVMALHASFTIGYDFGGARFNDCVVLSGMSQGGDSGSIILDEKMNAVALLFAGSNKVTLACPISYPVNEYGLVPYNTTIKSQDAEDGTEWRLKAVNGVISATDTTLQVNSVANASCYVEKKLEQFSSISVKIKPINDLSSEYGPGMAMISGREYIKVNLTRTGIQGNTHNGNTFLPLAIDPEGEYMIRFKRFDGKIYASLLAGTSFVDVTNSTFCDNCETMLRIGKMSSNASDGKCDIEGEMVSCFFSDLKIS